MTEHGISMKPSIAAILPMRHHSERIPGKNYRSFSGKPLYHHITESLLACPEIDTVMIDTDSDFILQDAAAVFPGVFLYQRPVHLRDGMTPMNDVLLNSVKQIAADFYVQTHSTNPLLRAGTISAAIKTFVDLNPAHDSLFSVTRLQSRLWSKDAEPINHDPGKLMRTQDLEPLFEENSCLYIFSGELLIRSRNRIGERPTMFEIGKIEAQDIDFEEDFRIAEALFGLFRATGVSEQ